MIFCTSDGKRIGILEFENTYDRFVEKVESLRYYDRRNDMFPDLEFGLLVIWFSKKPSNTKDIKKEVAETKKLMQKYSKINNLKYILYNSLWDEDTIGFIKKFDQGNKEYNNCFLDYECIVYQKGKTKYIKKFDKS